VLKGTVVLFSHCGALSYFVEIREGDLEEKALSISEKIEKAVLQIFSFRSRGLQRG